MRDKKRTSTGKVFRTGALALTLVAGAFAAACDDDPTGPEGDARIRVLLTDAPSDMLDSAHVWISQVYVTGAGADEAEEVGEPDPVEPTGEGASPAPAQQGQQGQGRVVLFDDPENPQLFDLLELRNGVTADLTGDAPVDLTTYAGLRLVVDSARVTLSEGFAFADGSRQAAFTIPSGGQSGIKVQLTDVLATTEGGTLEVTVDFDVDRNFQIMMSPQSETEVQRILFTPRLVELAREVDES